MGKDSSLDGACEISIQIDDSNNNRHTTSYKKTYKTFRKKNSSNCYIGDSLVRDVKGWKLSDEKNKVVAKHFSGAKTKDMEFYIIPTLEQIPKTIIIRSGTNDLRSN